MADYTVELKDFAAHIERKLKAMADSVPLSLARTAVDGAIYIKGETVPIAFEELKDAIHITSDKNGAKIIADAPHAAAVEIGSRPHTPPIEPLIRWVKLRGMQGLTKRGKVRVTNMRIGQWTPKSGFTPRRIARMQAFEVATSLRAMESKGSLSVDAPEQVARAIQHAISVSGTKPYRYMFKALPKIVKIMVGRIKEGFQAAIDRT